MEIDAVTEKARKGELLPVYLLGGDELILVQRCADAIRVATVGPGPRGLSEDLYDGRGLSAQTVVNACRTLPMMSKRRLVTVRGVDEMSTGEQESLLAYFAKPEPSTVLLLIANDLDTRRKLALEAKKHGFLFAAKHPDEASLGPWIEREAKSRGLAMEAGAVESLSMLVGPDLSLLGDALERLALYTGGAAVTADAVDQVVTPVRQLQAWDLADALGERNLPAALAVVARLTSQRQAALMTLGALAWRVHQLARARQFLSQNDNNPRGISSVIKARPDEAQKIAAQARRWSPAQLHRAFRVLAATDAALKGAKRGDERVLEECAIALCGGPGFGEAAG